MKPESGEKGQGEEEEIPIGNISETVFHRGSVSGIFSVFAVERRVCMSQMRLPPRLPAVQWTVSVCPLPPSGLCNGRDGTS